MQPVNLTVSECATVLNLGITKVRQLIRTGEILSFHEGRRVLVPIAAVNEYQQQRLDQARNERDGHRARELRKQRMSRKSA
ncbi:MAG TPA: helix-turn-helix domain-containing protein [Chloroflexota bacterium]|nr:helix-turn-helix domain-containing protein [Chloroflexota bacterium]